MNFVVGAQEQTITPSWRSWVATTARTFIKTLGAVESMKGNNWHWQCSWPITKHRNLLGDGCITKIKDLSCRPRAANQSPRSRDSVIAVSITILNFCVLVKAFNNLRSKVGLHPTFFLGNQKVLGIELLPSVLGRYWFYDSYAKKG